ncbi:MAG: fused MFS/spermidine synthase [Isosphaeraceae bacterium]|nr:fused MFS/spermidine synthase [Isosphaeraceae bacterium]
MSTTEPALAISTPVGTGRGRTAPVLALFLLSGATGLMLEVVWSRMLVGLFGSTTWGVLTVLVVFMGGLGLGSLLWGRAAARSERPLRLYAWLELGIGLYTLCVPLFFTGVGWLFVAVSRTFGEGSAGGSVVRVLAAALALAVPTTLMGGTLPVLTRFVSRGWDRPGRAAGMLYAANTFGAVLGCFATGFALILWLGLSTTNALAGAIDLGIGLLVLAWDFGSPRLPPDEPAAAVSTGGPPPVKGPSIVLAIAALSGFCGLAYEVLWTRGLLAALTESTTYAFTLMLTVFLAGHAAGSALGSRMRAPSAAERAREWRWLGLAQVWAGVTAMFTLPLLVLAQGPLDWVWITTSSTFWGTIVPFHLGVCVLILFVPAAFLGASFPLAARLYVGPGRASGSGTGRLYGLNTAGAIAGAVLAAALLVPRFGTQHTLVILGTVQVIQGVLTYVVGGRDGRWLGRLGNAVVLLALTAGTIALNTVLPLAAIYSHKEAGKLVDVLEGPGVTVTVHQRSAEDRVININSINVAGTNRVLRTTQKVQAHLPLLLHPAPRSVLQIGFGAGGTCWSVAQHDEITAIDVAEISPEVLAMARRYFADINHGVLDDPRVHVRIVDARSYMAVTDRTYDLILSDSIHPRFRGNAALYTRDYFALCAQRLRPGGLVSSWLPLYGLSVDDLRSVLKSLQSVFPHVQVWYPNTTPNENTVIVGSLEPIRIDWDRFTRQLAEPAIAADLAEVGVRGAFQTLDFFLTGDDGVSALATAGHRNTDDHPTLEFLAPRTINRQRAWLGNFQALITHRESVVPLVRGTDPAVRAELERWQAGTRYKLAAQVDELEGRVGDAVHDYAECVRTNPDDREAARRLDALRRTIAPTGPNGSR